MAELLNDGAKGSNNRWRTAAWGVAAVLLLLPLIAMQFTQEVNWDLADFIVFGVMLVSVGVAYELAVRMTSNGAYRLASGVALAGSFLLVWVNGAVGLVGDANNPANLLYGAVIVTGVAAAVIARFRPRGMVWAMCAMAACQSLVAVMVGIQHGSDSSVAEIALLNGFFVVLFLGAAALYRYAGRA